MDDIKNTPAFSRLKEMCLQTSKQGKYIPTNEFDCSLRTVVAALGAVEDNTMSGSEALALGAKRLRYLQEKYIRDYRRYDYHSILAGLTHFYAPPGPASQSKAWLAEQLVYASRMATRHASALMNQNVDVTIYSLLAAVFEPQYSPGRWMESELQNSWSIVAALSPQSLMRQLITANVQEAKKDPLLHDRFMLSIATRSQ
jgi:hypothetical protein